MKSRMSRATCSRMASKQVGVGMSVCAQRGKDENAAYDEGSTIGGGFVEKLR